MSLLEVSSISVRFGGLMAVDNVSLNAEAGRITGLIGPNGAGKTTTFNVITGLQNPTMGRVIIDGREVNRLPPHKRARLGMARTFQRLELFGVLTARENVMAAASMSARWRSSKDSPGAIADRLLERVGLTAVADVPAGSLPTGQGRLVELARALATEPKLLLLDEPASGQDDQETEYFSELLKQLAGEGIGILLVEHDMALVMAVCDYLYVLDFGRLLAEGTPAEVRRHPDVLAAYLGREYQDD